jgi:predicted nucleotidyltransferase component of viral defense system
MKDYALSLLEEVSDITSRRNILREYLQAYILRILHERNCFEHIAFIGGTSLRLLHGLPRFSEDLDFSLISSELFNFEKLLKGLKSDLTGSGYSVDISFKSNKAVNSAFIKFQTLLFEAEISPMKSQNMSIKIEIDSNPPEGALQETRVLLVYSERD